MTTTAVFAMLAAGTFVLLSVVAWYLVQALIQARQTALALEQFLNVTRPRVEEAADRLGAVLGRTDRFLESFEEARGSTSGMIAMIGQALSGWLAGIQAVSTVSAGIAAIVKSWSNMSKSRTSASTEATAGGIHE